MADNIKFAAIDVGSNAVRLLLSRAIDTPDGVFLKRESLIRMPIRLGADVFSGKPISKSRSLALVNSMKGFRCLIDAYQPVAYTACATSAMRDATNGKELTARIARTSGIDLHIISGRREAEVICSVDHAFHFDRIGAHLYIDVGGGSVELTLFSSKRIVESRSFNIGAVRILQNTVDPKEWLKLDSWLMKISQRRKGLVAIGSGGSVNKIYRLARVGNASSITPKNLRDLHSRISIMTVNERIGGLKLRPDRADVIVPAAEILLRTCKKAGIARLFVPEIGLADGLVHLLHNRYRRKK